MKRVYLSVWIGDDLRVYFSEQQHRHLVSNSCLQAGIKRGQVVVTCYVAHWNYDSEYMNDSMLRDVARAYLDGTYKVNRFDFRS